MPWVRRAAKRRHTAAVDYARQWSADERAAARQRLIELAERERRRHP
ncbi:hypothetical protein OWR29_27285 [Actinoplanes sp. Pm04-4]|uniref:Uncharacterized protein n=1 Tax=Paractinoplanes pyxinae TaxID=2997416 RepID=A0ABT4B7X6_9ACTN|nr:hypothetical protein [Actinoplanes pyxinae]MCY1141718.1 hypothetical protein [Actinoplanes pyxinae]